MTTSPSERGGLPGSSDTGTGGVPISECICYPGMCPMGCEPACPYCFQPLPGSLDERDTPREEVTPVNDQPHSFVRDVAEQPVTPEQSRGCIASGATSTSQSGGTVKDKRG